jgi:hypothetical protein
MSNRDLEIMADERLQAETLTLRNSLQEASEIIQALAHLIAGWEHLPAVPADLRERAEEFGADFSG